jgi:membrane protein insertase Oxa1/YidC/SpoIIIJ
VALAKLAHAAAVSQQLLGICSVMSYTQILLSATATSITFIRVPCRLLTARPLWLQQTKHMDKGQVLQPKHKDRKRRSSPVQQPSGSRIGPKHQQKHEDEELWSSAADVDFME